MRTHQNCKVFERFKDECKSCFSGFFKDASNTNGCTKNTQVSNCAVYSKSMDSCDLCESHYYLEDKHKCTSVDSPVINCKRYSNKHECLKCFENYFLQNNVCSKGNINFCDEYDNESTCKLCKDQYFLEDNTCKEHDSDLFCDQYHINKNECESCPDEYQLSQEKKCEEINHCDILAEDLNSCIQCSKEYFLHSQTKKCTERTNQTCKSFRPDLDQCETCQETDYLDIEDKYTCKQRMSKSDQCQRYDVAKDRCLECMNDWILADGTCLDPKRKIDNCLQYASDGKCTLCELGFSAFGDLCMPENCVQVKDKVCIGCKSGYFLKHQNFGTNSANNAFKNNCSKYSAHLNCSKLNPSKDECEVCSIGYDFDDYKRCVYQEDFSKNCQKKHQSEPKCLKCNPGFKLTKTHICERDICSLYDESRKCVRCQEDYTLDLDTSECIYLEEDEECLEYDSINETCATCREGFYKNEDFGDKCFEVNEVEHCEFYLKNKNRCKKCFDSYFLENNHCIRHDADLEYLNYFEDCVQCNQNTVYVKPVCLKNGDFHDSKDKSSNCALAYTFMSIFLISLLTALGIFWMFYKKRGCFKDKDEEMYGYRRERTQSHENTNVSNETEKQRRSNSSNSSNDFSRDAQKREDSRDTNANENNMTKRVSKVIVYENQ